MCCQKDKCTSALGNMPRLLKILLILAIIALSFAFFTKRASSEPIYRFTSPNGSLAFTDNPKLIPAAATNVSNFEMSGLPDRTTHVETQPLATSAYPQALSEPTPRIEPSPTGPTTVVREWVQDGAIHRQVWKTVAPDGQVLMVTPSAPRGLIVR